MSERFYVDSAIYFDMEAVRRQMKAYRCGETGLPESYIHIHECCARKDSLSFLIHHNCEFVSCEMVNDGWLDGMQVLEVKATDRLGKPRVFRWSDANGGSWFERLESGGQVLVCKAAKAPGYL